MGDSRELKQKINTIINDSIKRIEMEYLISELIPLIAKSIPALSLVDEDYGQLENIDDTDDERQMYPITFPCVLIDAPETEWSNLAPGIQKGVLHYAYALHRLLR